MSKKSFSNIILLIVIVAVLVGVSGCKSTPQTTSSKIDTSTWKTYELANPNFPNWEIKFPQNYKCPEGQYIYVCSEKSVPVAGVTIDENGRVILGVNYASINLCTEDLLHDTNPPATFCVSIEAPRKWSSSQDFFNYLKSQFSNSEEIEKMQKQNVNILKINNPVIINGHKTVKIESTAEGTHVDRYFVEIDNSNFIRLTVVKHKLEESQKRTAEIETIISSFKFSR